MKKIYDYFKKVTSNNRLGHSFLIGNINFNDYKNEIEDVLSDFFFEKKINIDNNSDVIIVEPEGKSVTKNQVKQLIYNLNNTSQISGKKVYIILNCEDLSDYIYNTLLKIIEEPSANIYAILITSNIDNVIDTIKSRCQQIFISSFDKKVNNEFEEIALQFVNNINKYGIKFIGFNKDLYSKIKSRDECIKVFENISYLYKKRMNSIINNEDFNDGIILKEEIYIISKKIIILNELIKKIDYNINKDLIIDKLVIEFWRCSNECSKCNI